MTRLITRRLAHLEQRPLLHRLSYGSHALDVQLLDPFSSPLPCMQTHQSPSSRILAAQNVLHMQQLESILYSCIAGFVIRPFISPLPPFTVRMSCTVTIAKITSLAQWLHRYRLHVELSSHETSSCFRMRCVIHGSPAYPAQP